MKIILNFMRNLIKIFSKLKYLLNEVRNSMFALKNTSRLTKDMQEKKLSHN